MNIFFLIAGMALVTFAIRYPVLALVGKIQMPEPIFRALRFVPGAVLTAIIVPSVLLVSPSETNLMFGGARLVGGSAAFSSPGDLFILSLGNANLIAAIVAVLVAWRTKNLLLTIVIGMLALWGWHWLLQR